MRAILNLTLVMAVIFATGLSAGLVDKHFPDKTEKQIAEDFEDSLGAYLQNALTKSDKPRMYFEIDDEMAYLELSAVEVDDDECKWKTLVRDKWIVDEVRYAYVPYGTIYTLRNSKLPPGEIALWFNPEDHTPAQIISASVWLAEEKELRLANECLSRLANAEKELRPAVEAWLVTRYGWELPDDGLTVVSMENLDRHRDITLFLTGEELEDYRDDLEDTAKDEFEKLEEMQGGDVKSEPGNRKRSPTVRLDALSDRLNRYKQTFGDTEFFKKQRTQDGYDSMLKAVEADIEFVEAEKYKAERIGIDGDWPAAAKAHDALYRTDPKMPDIIERTALAWSKAAVIKDAARKSKDPEAARKSAELWEQLCGIHPLSLRFRNYAGINRQAAGDKKMALVHYNHVIRRTDNRTDLSTSEKQNREYAERQLKYID